jgi:hypothetical protein
MLKRILVIIAAAGGLLIYTGLIEPYWINVEHHHLSVHGMGPDTLIVVHIADVHTSGFGRREARTISLIEDLHPDYVFLTGDLITSKGPLSAGMEFISRIPSRRGVFAVPGNADKRLFTAIDRGRIPRDTLGCRILMNESADCAGFTLVGLDDPVTGRERLNQAFSGVTGRQPVLVLTHFHPERLLVKFRERPVDVVFSGHTHGGQLGIGPLVNLVPYAHRSSFMGGIYDLGEFTLIVTVGIGTNIFPFRFLCRPEILVFHMVGSRP